MISTIVVLGVIIRCCHIPPSNEAILQLREYGLIAEFVQQQEPQKMSFYMYPRLHIKAVYRELYLESRVVRIGRDLRSYQVAGKK